ncbi:MAG: LacI family DNA-binding transcriptional regulator [Chthoniobacteraceae bacterium]
MKKRVSIRDIAATLGLHHTTVSLALRDSPSLKPETKQKIQAAAVELGYRPDPMLTALAAYRQSKRPSSFHAVIAWINNWKDREAIFEVPTYRAYYEGACETAQTLGYAVQEFWMHERGMTPARMQHILKARNISGLLLPPQPSPGATLHFDFQDFPAITFGFSLQPSVLHLVTCHHSKALDLLMSHLVAKGYRRPGYCILDFTDSVVNYEWVSRLAYLYTKYPALVPIPRLTSLEHGVIAKWIKKYKPDVLIGYSFLLSQVEALSYRVPEDIGYASLAVDLADPHISGISQNDRFIGKIAVDLLVGMIHRGERGVPPIPIRTLIDSTWVEGETLRPDEKSNS